MLLTFQAMCQLMIVHWICNKVVVNHLIKGNSKEASQIEWVESGWEVMSKYQVKFF